MSYYAGGNETDASSVHSSHARGTATPTSSANNNNPGFLYSAFGGIMRRLSSEPNGGLVEPQPHPQSTNNGVDGVYTPITRTASPLLLRPPPLEPLTLTGFAADTPASARLLTPAIAEEIRIMVPERLRIEDHWKLAYSLEQDGASLATLYEKAAVYDEHRIGFLLVVRDSLGEGVFGAYLTEYPRPSAHYFGTGECFLWRASFNGTSAARTQTQDLLGIDASQNTSRPHSASADLRFAAFPYSGVNEYFIYCEAHSLSVGGGDGRYGLWLNDSLEKGVSATSLTFGNQPLSDEGEKFGVLGVELWVIGSRR